MTEEDINQLKTSLRKTSFNLRHCEISNRELLAWVLKALVEEAKQKLVLMEAAKTLAEMIVKEKREQQNT